jgi:hypothetical protein
MLPCLDVRLRRCGLTPGGQIMKKFLALTIFALVSHPAPELRLRQIWIRDRV